MKFVLKDYQADAVGEVLDRLGQARESFKSRYAARSAFSLTATTGAGKTVMAAAVIEALFEGNDDHDFDADPGAVVLWFTDDPSLNEQTRFRLMEASDLPWSRLRVIQPTFQAERLEPGNVYFLNAQKLSKNSLLVKGAPTDEDEALPTMPVAPDLRANTMWEILRNTIEDERLTLYLVLDEAHKGMRAPTGRERNEKQSIVRRLINGEAGAPPVPIVWGISATVKRFEDAMSEVAGRTTLPPVVVDPGRVQESGLLKDDVRLDFPAESGQFDTVLLTRAVRRTQEAALLWQEYAASQDPPLEPVVPLLVVQLPNTPSDDLLVTAFRTVREAWPELSDDAMAHVFGEHRTIELGGFTVPHIAPEKVQDSTWVSVLFAKDAISTGWDCPRAEVLMSFRAASDETHITQLLGRMVRTPLARRVPGNDRLNSVECLLPRFNRTTAVSVAELLLGRRDEESGGSGGGGGRRSLYSPVDLTVNESIPDSVWAAFDRMPSQTLPRKGARPVKRLLALAHALSRDGLLPGARGRATAEMCDVLDGLMARHRVRVNAAADNVRELSGETVVAGLDSTTPFGQLHFSELTDQRAVDADFAAAGRVLTRELALAFADRLADDADDDDDGLLDAHIRVAALSRVPGVADELDREADALAGGWLDEHRVAIKALSDERRTAYDEIVAMAAEPQRVDVLRPRVRAESGAGPDGTLYERVPGHLMSDPDGGFPIGSLNEWERAVLREEAERPDFLAFYRNPSRGSADSLAVAYRDGNQQWRRLCPDFVFFHGTGPDVRISIVDPHGIHLADALPKLRGLADFAATYAADLHRVEGIAEVDGRMRVLDLTQPSVRDAVAAATEIEELYRSPVARRFG